MREHSLKSQYYRAAYDFPQEHRSVASLNLFQAAQREAGRFVEPGMTGVTMQINRMSRRGIADLDFGAGRFKVDLSQSCFVVAPVDQQCVYSVPTAIELLVVEFPDFACLGEAVQTEQLARLHSSAWADPVPMKLADLLWTAGETGLSALEADYLRMALSSLLARAAQAMRPDKLRGGLAPRQLKLIHEYLQAHLTDDVTLAEMAGLVRLSPFHFARAFKISTGVPPHRWVQQQRVERAKGLLEASDLNMLEVAMSVGYKSSGHFARVFRRETGVSPRAFKAEKG